MSLVPDYIDKLVPYKPGKPIDEVRREFDLDVVHKLASNENPFGPSPLALEAIIRVLGDLHHYPDTVGSPLRQALADHYRVKLDNVIIGSGSEGIMACIVRAFLHGDEEALTSEGSFIGFNVLVQAQGIRLKKVALMDFGFDLDAIARAVTHQTKVIYLANPNNPTGTIFDRQSFERFIDSVPDHILIVLDEAYYEYVPKLPTYPDSQLYRRDNVITLRTFSKAYGLAGLRIGYGLAHEDLIRSLLKVKLPFEPAQTAQAAALAALSDIEFLQKTLDNNRVGLKQITEGLKGLGLDPIPSYANFVCVDLGAQATVDRLFDGLLRKGVIVRPLAAFGLPTCLRISVGTPEQNEACLTALARLLG